MQGGGGGAAAVVASNAGARGRGVIVEAAAATRGLAGRPHRIRGSNTKNLPPEVLSGFQARRQGPHAAHRDFVRLARYANR